MTYIKYQTTIYKKTRAPHNRWHARLRKLVRIFFLSHSDLDLWPSNPKWVWHVELMKVHLHMKFQSCWWTRFDFRANVKVLARRRGTASRLLQCLGFSPKTASLTMIKSSQYTKYLPPPNEMHFVVRIITCLQGQMAWQALPVESHFVNK